VSLRRRAAGAQETPAGARPARDLDEIAWQRAACDLARSFHGAPRNGGVARSHRSRLGSARIAFALGGPEALPARAGAPARHAAARPRGRDTRSLRPSRLSDDPETREARRAVRD